MLKNNDVNQEKEINKLQEWVMAIVMTVIVTFIIKMFILDTAEVKGVSMNPTLANNDRLIISRIETFFRDPKRFEIVIFHSPFENATYVKRIIGLPGDSVEIREGKVYVNGSMIDEKYIGSNITTLTVDSVRWEIPEGQYFVMGDNRKPNESVDSRYFGPVDRKEIEGYAMFRYFPFNKIGDLD